MENSIILVENNNKHNAENNYVQIIEFGCNVAITVVTKYT